MKRGLTGYIFPIILVAVAVFLLLRFGGGPAEKPRAFVDSMTLHEATAQANELNKPVLVFATADWCGPCQRLKRTSLADERVNDAILQQTVPVYLDLTHAHNNETLAAEAQRLGVQGMPTLLLMRHGEVISRRGPMTAAQIIDWLDVH